jgi:hypothetical protein
MLNIPNLNKKSSQKFAGDLEFGPPTLLFPGNRFREPLRHYILSKGIPREPILRGIFLRRPARANTTSLFFSEALRKKMRRRFFRPKLCAGKCDVAFFVRSSAQENAPSLFYSEALRKKMRRRFFSPKLCAGKYRMAFFSEGLRGKMLHRMSAKGNPRMPCMP